MGMETKGKDCAEEERLTAAEIRKALPSGWKVKGRIIESRRLDFDTFPVAIKFVGRLALIAERENHHPEIMVSWKRVTLQLTTHDAGGITALDIRMAGLVNRLVRSFSGSVRYLNK